MKKTLPTLRLLRWKTLTMMVMVKLKMRVTVTTIIPRFSLVQMKHAMGLTITVPVMRRMPLIKPPGMRIRTTTATAIPMPQWHPASSRLVMWTTVATAMTARHWLGPAPRILVMASTTTVLVMRRTPSIKPPGMRIRTTILTGIPTLQCHPASSRQAMWATVATATTVSHWLGPAPRMSVMA